MISQTTSRQGSLAPANPLRLLLPTAAALFLNGAFFLLAPTAALAEPKPVDAAKSATKARQVIPSPYKPDEVERDHMTRYDKAIAEVQKTNISDGDAAQLREAVKAFGGAKLNKGLEHRAAIRDPLAAKIADWFRLRSGYGTAVEYRTFLDQNPAWPDRRLLVQRLEEALFTQGGTSTDIRAHFAKGGPDHGVGFAALASSYLAEGRTEEARTYAVKVWREMTLPSTLETGFLDRFGSLLTAADHKARLDRLLVDNIRWKGERNQRAAVVRRLIPLLPKTEQRKAQARLAVFLQKEGSRAEIEALPTDETTDWGLVFHKVQALRRANQIDEAAKLMLTVPTAPGAVVNNDEWWIERRTNAYAALRIGKPKLAYQLVREAGPLSVNPLKDQNFVAGWIALRYLNDAAAAKRHFEAMHKAADGPLSRAKASYWLGRTAEVMKDKNSADAFYKEATGNPDTFHGQLAMQKLNPGSQTFPISPPAAPTADEIRRFNNLDAVKALIIADKAKLDTRVTRAFLTQLRFFLNSEAEMAMIAHLAEALGDTQMAVRTAKSAVGRGHNLLYYSYPVHPFPAYSPLREPPEPAFLLGIARQETEFNTKIVSGAGAKGLLQVMTVTAKHVCSDYKIKCDIKRLLSDPAYNTMMGSAYIGDRMRDFSGSYVLTLAGYNAGPGRARQWIREFGDPRDPKIDPIDWIERIPIQETREYVAKVLSNVQVYRARLGEADVALRLEKDLNRARLAAGITPRGSESRPSSTAASGG